MNSEEFLFAAFAIILLVVLLAVMKVFRTLIRIKNLRALATQMQFKFRWGQDRQLANRLRFLDVFAVGHSHRITNILEGVYLGQRVAAFDLTYSIGFGKQEATYRRSVIIAYCDADFPKLKICDENWLDKLAQALGDEDIDFESIEFSRKYNLRGSNKRFAYDICHPAQMEYLLTVKVPSIQYQHDLVAFFFDSLLSTNRYLISFEQIAKLAELVPGHVRRSP